MSQEALLHRVDPTDLVTVQDWVEAATPSLRNRMVKRCGTDVGVHVDYAEDRRLDEVLARVGVTACSFVAEPSNLRGLILLDAGLVRSVVGRFLGESVTVPNADRPLSKLDLRFATHLGHDVLAALQEAIPLRPAPRLVANRMSNNPRTVQHLPLSRHVLEVQCTLGPATEPLGKVWMVFPPQGAGVLWQNRGPTTNVRHHPAVGLKRVLPVSMNVIAELARQRMPLARAKAIAVGDVLDFGPLGDVKLRVGDRVLMTAEPGDADGVRSARVKRRV